MVTNDLGDAENGATGPCYCGQPLASRVHHHPFAGISHDDPRVDPDSLTVCKCGFGPGEAIHHNDLPPGAVPMPDRVI